MSGSLHTKQRQMAEQTRGTPEKSAAFFKNIYIGSLRHKHTQTMAHNKFTDSLITAMVFTNEDTNGLVIHINGFETEQHAQKFVKKLMKNSGIEYKSIRDMFDLPTIH